MGADPSGAGKSTASEILLRFHAPDTVSVLPDGTPLRDFPLEYVALLPQETLVLHDTARANIACGRPGASDHTIEEAARAADAREFITALPEALRHLDRPQFRARLSGGQLHRLAIAHDLSPALDADRILLADRCRLVDTGRHNDLLAHGGGYAHLYGSRSTAFVEAPSGAYAWTAS
ncbi:ATP-binding cassette domain-containing protein [Streptomyces sp. NPDC002740]